MGKRITLQITDIWGVQEYTNYYFDCNPAALHGALDRFSQFFVAPLCKADALEREVNAVDNEFSGVLLLESIPPCICTCTGT